MKLILSFLFLLFISNFVELKAQDSLVTSIPCAKQKMNEQCDRGWFSVNLGADNREFLHISARVSFGRNTNYQASLSSSSSIFGSRYRSFVDFYKGISSVNKIGRVAAFVGPSIVFDSENQTTIGLASNAQVSLTPFLPIGTGLDFYFNTNPYGITYSLGLSLVIEGHK